MQPSRSEFLTVRGLRCHVRHWGRDGAPKLFMLHGWMDVSASFQFVVDELRGDWHVIAPDWRGFGLSQRGGADTYWFPDYLADLDAILRHYAPDAAVDLLGHSMGGNVVGLYAGARPERIRKLVNLEGFGLRDATPEQAPARYAKWLDELQEPPSMRGYPTLAAVAARLQKTNPRLTDDKAALLAPHWSAQNDAGDWEILGDPVHKQASPLLYRVEEMLACWRRITRAGAVGRGRRHQYVAVDGAEAGGAHRDRPPPRPPGRRALRDDGGRRPHAAPRPARGAGAA